MKIHTTQNLNSLVQGSQSTNSVSIKDFRLKIFSEQMPEPLKPASADFYGTSVSFGKGPTAKDAKKIVKASKKMVGDISKKPHPVEKREDNVYKSPLFNWILSKYEFEPVIQAAAAAVICMALRPATIMALPAKGKNKEDNIYASSHSFASGMMGLAAAIIVTAPFKQGGKYVTEVMRKHFEPETLKKLYPHLDIKSIWQDEAKNTRKPMEKWLDKNGNRFMDSKDTIQYTTQFKQLADISDETYRDILKLDVDWVSQKGKSFNDVVLKDGSKLYDKIGMDNLGIIVKEDGFGEASILLQDFDKEYLTKLIQDSKGTNWGNLDINSVYSKQDGKEVVNDFRKWKDINGNQWKLDLDEIHVSSYLEEMKGQPRITGRKRFDTTDNEYKFVSYQDNGKNGKLGTAIDEELITTANRNNFKTKLLTWGPDIATRIPIAATTIALIPWTLKNIFGIEKSKKKKAAKANAEKNTENATQISENKENKNGVSFKGKKAPKPEKVEKEANWIIRQIGKYYGKPIIESDKIAKWADKLSQSKNLTQHMMALGSFITSSVYMTRTLQNKDLDPERKKTLALNQGLCFVIPTAGAYLADRALNGFIKDREYRYTDVVRYEQNMAKHEGRKAAKWAADIGRRSGIRIMGSIGIFSLIYRYITPVLVTPAANWLSDKFFTNDNHKEETAKEIPLNPTAKSTNEVQVAKEIPINSSDSKQYRQSA